jgi:hypothetical protein
MSHGIAYAQFRQSLHAAGPANFAWIHNISGVNDVR